MDNIVKEYHNKNENRFRNFLSNLSFPKIAFIGFVIFVLIFITTKKSIDPIYHYAIYFVLLVIIVYLYFKPTEDKKIISRKVATKIAKEEILEMQREGVFSSQSELHVTEYSNLRWKDDLVDGSSKPLAWDVGFEELIQKTKFKREGVISIHPYDGVVTGIKEMPTGFTGKEFPDIKVVPVGVIMGDKGPMGNIQAS